jgi:hypothetical protein
MVTNLKEKKEITKLMEKKKQQLTAVSRNGEARDLSEIGKVFN